MLDIHCHILPAVDDGAQSLDTSIRMLDAARAAGITSLIATPHVKELGMDFAAIYTAWQQLQPHAESRGIRLHLGYEVNIAALREMDMQWVERLCITQTNCILLEFPYTLLPPNWDVLLSEICRSGFTPIIAHPERCVYVQRTPELLGEMRGYGCELQITARALLGPLAHPERKLCRTLVKRALVDYVASDAHDPSHYDAMRRAFAWMGDRAPHDGLLEGYLA